MTLPRAVIEAGYKPASQLNLRGLMLKINGLPDGGKTELALSGPGPGVCVLSDRGYKGMLRNPSPPQTRNPDIWLKTVEFPSDKDPGAAQELFVRAWNAYRAEVYTALALGGISTVVVDGDSDTWDIQKLAHYGKKTQIPPMMWESANSTRKAMLTRCQDSGKVVIFTSKMKKHYADVLDTNGIICLDDSGKPKREWDGTYDASGYNDQGYFWEVEVLAMKHDAKSEWGLQIQKNKSDPGYVGQELWGDECNLKTLFQFIFPHIDINSWGQWSY